MAKNDKAPDAGATETSAQDVQLQKRKPADDGLRTPDEWARALGRTVERRVTVRVGKSVRSQVVHQPDHIHAAAATLHGWAAHEYHAGAPMRLAEADYRAAIRQILDWGKEGKPLAPHEPARSPHHPMLHVAEINARIAREAAEEIA